MNNQQAGVILDDQVKHVRAKSFQELCQFIKAPDVSKVSVYQVEINAMWDDQPNGNLRVIVSIDDGGRSAFMPMTADFIISPSGSFIDE